ncbi:MAG TPA: 50S ribosomal protein L28 [Phaeodactylibacter sp.]|nr:50S ribosomal protein L28 [Phaeodactylibacter sp.]
MSRVCQLTGKRPISGNNVSHSNRKTRRRFLPNLQKKRFYIPELDKWVTLKVSSKALRSINKLGIMAYLEKMERKGTITDLNLNALKKKKS